MNKVIIDLNDHYVEFDLGGLTTLRIIMSPSQKKVSFRIIFHDPTGNVEHIEVADFEYSHYNLTSTLVHRNDLLEHRIDDVVRWNHEITKIMSGVHALYLYKENRPVNLSVITSTFLGFIKSNKKNSGKTS